jgi:hypothetical protein
MAPDEAGTLCIGSSNIEATLQNKLALQYLYSQNCRRRVQRGKPAGETTLNWLILKQAELDLALDGRGPNYQA